MQRLSSSIGDHSYFVAQSVVVVGVKACLEDMNYSRNKKGFGSNGREAGE
jgi:dUTPase